ncbi:MAG TPA: protein kinase, partial [Gemmatimonadales bacterium]|nr:protein kinase [Gemmatimonadales bacterium]
MIVFEPGAPIGTFRLVRPLGKGGFAEVWEAQSETDGRRVALKVLTEIRADSARALERFEQEGRLAASISSTRCVYIFAAGAVEGYPYIAMELMPGGTLADRIESGPLSSRAAVDYVLDVLDGLEAAQGQGILHRDVKPSNVFLDADGRAKIGDFGISKSLEADSKLSQTGAFLGTPYYASPEQIAAEPLDLRSDLYSVGAMLYELLTGKLPYQGTNASQVLAQVLTREPVPFAETGVAVPDGLQQVVMRLLAKQREKRHQTYDEARNALMPFSSRGLAVAPLSRRFGAIFIDLGLLFFPIGLLGGAYLVGNGFRNQVELTLALHFSQLLYFSLTEWLGGASLGKRLLGLRVTTIDGGSVSLPVVVARTFVFLVLYAGPGVVFQQLANRGITFGSGALEGLFPLLAEIAGLGVMMLSMRARNGYAGAHELLTKTRVMALVTRDRAVAVVASPAAVRETADQDRRSYGPYRGTGVHWSTGGASLEVARDEALRRDVWIHAADGEKGLPSLEVLRERGAGSLPWLQRGTSGGVTWDAYGAPEGTSLIAAGTTGLDWRQMRVLLRSLVAELQSRFKRQSSAGTLGPEHVWIDLQGHAVLLDFPAPGPSALQGGTALEVTPATWRDFVTRVVATGFRDSATGRVWPFVPLPEHARTLLA